MSSSSSRTTTSSSGTLSISSISNANLNATAGTIPGSTIVIYAIGLSSTVSDNSVTVNGTSATVLTASTSNITFTMPDLSSSVTENQTVTVSLTSGSKTGTTTITYYALTTVPVNTTNTISRTLAGTGASNSHWYKFTTAGSTNIFNVSGYTSRDIDMYIYLLPTSSSYTTAAITTTTNAEILRTSSLTSGTTYYLEVRMYSGSSTTYNIGIASQAITGAASCSVHPTLSRCIDYLFNNSASQSDCTTSGGTYTAGGTCSGLALGTIVGRCTSTSGTNIGTTSYYSNGTTPFSAGTASTNCSGISNSIFQ